MTPLSPLATNRPMPATRRQSRAANAHSLFGGVGMLIALSIGSIADAPPAVGVTGQLVFSSPTRPLAVQRLASLPQRPWLAGHRGIDLATVTAAVTAPAAGVVTYVGFVVDRPVLSIRHDHGFVSSFEPIDSTLSVGDRVARGQTVGTVADAPNHCAHSACIHWGLRLDGEYVDPLDYLEGFGQVRLLPTAGY